MPGPDTRARARLGRAVAQAFRLAPVRPAVALGLRAVVALALPLVAGTPGGSPGTTWGVLGAFNGTLADKGGAYRARAAAIAAVSVGGVAAAVLAGLLSLAGVPAAAALLVWVTLATFAAVYGDAAGRAGTTVAVVFALAQAAPVTGLADALHRGLWLAGGGAWAAFLALALWPVRVYRPVRRAVAAVHAALAEARHEAKPRVAFGLAPVHPEDAPRRHAPRA